MKQDELKRLLEISILVKKDKEYDKSINDVADLIVKAIIRKNKKKKELRDTETLVEIFRTSYHFTLRHKPEHLIKLMPVFHMLCCSGTFNWKNL